jgi:glycosyltransferase involved in cell wall biosynthesis
VASVPIRFSTDLEHDLRSARLFLYLTRSEGLGSAALLAMSAAVPVIASRVGGLPEIIDHGRNGVLVPNDATVVAAAMRRLIDDAALAQRLGQEGRRTVEERFTIPRMAEATVEVYRRVLGLSFETGL